MSINFWIYSIIFLHCKHVTGEVTPYLLCDQWMDTDMVWLASFVSSEPWAELSQIDPALSSWYWFDL